MTDNLPVTWPLKARSPPASLFPDWGSIKRPDKGRSTMKICVRESATDLWLQVYAKKCIAASVFFGGRLIFCQTLSSVVEYSLARQGTQNDKTSLTEDFVHKKYFFFKWVLCSWMMTAVCFVENKGDQPWIINPDHQKATQPFYHFNAHNSGTPVMILLVIAGAIIRI